MKTIQPRMKNPAMLIPEAMQPFMAFMEAVRKSGVSQRALDLVHLRASQINGCSFCVDMGSRELKKAGETDDRLFSVAAWREAPYFTGAERAALALAEAVTRLSDRSDPVPEEIWNEATLHYDEKALAAWSFGSPRPTSSTVSTRPSNKWPATIHGKVAEEQGTTQQLKRTL